ncbi:MAG TPA: hypothetical protein VEW71_07430 [Allosphingosinicella sp.]|nr:hypothetical protein [Allosphingosinicella sp.]
MGSRNVLAAVAALSLLASGSVAAAQSARPLSLAESPAAQRAGAGMENSAELRGRRGGMGWILGVVALGILVFVILEASKDNNLPGSP